MERQMLCRLTGAGDAAAVARSFNEWDHPRLRAEQPVTVSRSIPSTHRRSLRHRRWQIRHSIPRWWFPQSLWRKSSITPAQRRSQTARTAGGLPP